MTSNIRTTVYNVLRQHGVVDVQQADPAIALLERRVETGQFNTNDVPTEVRNAARDAGLAEYAYRQYVNSVVTALEAEFIADQSVTDEPETSTDTVDRAATAEVVRALLVDAKQKAERGQIVGISDEDIDAFLVIAGLEDEPEPEPEVLESVSEATSLSYLSGLVQGAVQRLDALTEFARRHGFNG